MADEKQSENSIFTFIRGTSKILERLQREDEKEIESDNPASDYESDLSEASGDITDPSAYDGAPVDQYSEDEVYLEARRHRNDYCQLRIMGQNVVTQSDKGKLRKLKFKEESYMWVKPFPKGLTLIFENCGLKTKVKPEGLPPGDPRRETLKLAQFHVLHPECSQLSLQHEDYVNDERRDDSKTYPVWDGKLAAHNQEYRRIFILRLRKIIEAAGGACRGKR